MISFKIIKGTLALAAASASLLFAEGVAAADTEGNFSVRGYGSVSCQDFNATVEENDTEALLTYAHWLQGYYSAYNRMNSNTFDTVPIYGAGDLITLVRSICENIPEQPVETAANASINLFETAHLPSESELTTVERDGQQARLRVAVVANLQEALLELGYYDGTVDGLFGNRTAAAISSFQGASGLAETGLPDLATLVEVFTD